MVGSTPSGGSRYRAVSGAHAKCAQAGWYREIKDSSLQGMGLFFIPGSPGEREEVLAAWNR